MIHFTSMAITDRSQLPGGRLEPWMERLSAAGVECVQLREKDLGDRRHLELAESMRQLLPEHCRLLINGRADIALLSGADGVHLPSSGLPIPELRRRFGSGLLIGRSTHTPAELMRAEDEGADYVSYGPIFSTPSKQRYGPPRGLAELEQVAKRARIPIVALGGIDRRRIAAVLQAGATAIAGIRLFLDGDHLPELFERLRPAAAGDQR